MRRVTSAEQVQLGGGGGTDMRVGHRGGARGRDRPHVIVVLTDGYTPWPDEPPACRLIAALIGPSAPAAPPWVESVRVTG